MLKSIYSLSHSSRAVLVLWILIVHTHFYFHLGHGAFLCGYFLLLLSRIMSSRSRPFVTLVHAVIGRGTTGTFGCRELVGVFLQKVERGQVAREACLHRRLGLAIVNDIQIRHGLCAKGEFRRRNDGGYGRFGFRRCIVGRGRRRFLHLGFLVGTCRRAVGFGRGRHDRFAFRRCQTLALFQSVGTCRAILEQFFELLHELVLRVIDMLQRGELYRDAKIVAIFHFGNGQRNVLFHTVELRQHSVDRVDGNTECVGQGGIFIRQGTLSGIMSCH
jgi:hypothetical protein